MSEILEKANAIRSADATKFAEFLSQLETAVDKLNKDQLNYQGTEITEETDLSNLESYNYLLSEFNVLVNSLGNSHGKEVAVS